MPRNLVLQQSNHPRVKSHVSALRNIENHTLPELLHALHSFNRRQLRQWGRFVSTHQIFVILLSSFFILSLCYPVIFLYIWTTEGNSRLVDAQNLWRFVSKPARDRASFGAAVGDLKMPWEVGTLRGELLSTDDEMCWENVGVERVVRIEQVLVTTEEVLASGGGIGGPGVMDRRTLEVALNLQEKIQHMLKDEGIQASSCILSRDGSSCLVLSPWDFAALSHHTRSLPNANVKADELLNSALLSTTNHATLNLSLSGLPLSLESTFAGRVMRKDELIRANYLALTFFLESSTPSGISRSAHQGWIQSLARVSSDWARLLPAQRWAARRLFVLKYRPRLPLTDRSLEDAFYVMGYIVVLAHVWRKTLQVKGCHSRNGVRMAAAFSLAATGLMTFSVCALAGLDLGLAPWEMLPLLVIVSGADNLLILTSSITHTDFFLPVRERIAKGLERVGTSMFVFLFVETNLVIMIVRYVRIKTIKEWVGFIGVTLVTSYVMEMTFFLAVLSVDLGRLELGDLLQNNQDEKEIFHTKDNETAALPSVYTGLAEVVSATLKNLGKMLKERGAKVFTFGCLIIINTSLIIFYGREHYLPAFCSAANPDAPNHLLSPSLGNDLNNLLAKEYALSPPSSSTSPAEVFWKVINPKGASSVHIYVEPASVLALRSPAYLDAKNDGITWVWLKPLSLFACFVVLPLVISLVAVYLILLYLLKDSDKLALEREWARMSVPEQKTNRSPSFDLSLFKGRHQADVELVASNDEIVVTWSIIDDFLTVRRPSLPDRHPEALFIPIPKRQQPLISLAIDEDAILCAAISGKTGKPLIWSVTTGKLLPLLQDDDLSLSNVGRGITVAFVPSPSKKTAGGFVTLHEGGGIVVWDCSKAVGKPFVILDSKEGLIKTHLLYSHNPYYSSVRLPIIAQVSRSGNVVLWRVGQDLMDWREVASIPVTTVIDPVICLAVGGLANCLVLVVGCASGSTSLWDVESKGGKKLLSLTSAGHLGAAAKQIRVLGNLQTRCPRCLYLSTEYLVVAIGSSKRLLVQRVVLQSSCECSRRRKSTSLTTGGSPTDARQRPTRNSVLTPQSEEHCVMPDTLDSSNLMTIPVADLPIDERGSWELLGRDLVGIGRNDLNGCMWEIRTLESVDDLSELASGNTLRSCPLEELCAEDKHFLTEKNTRLLSTFPATNLAHSSQLRNRRSRFVQISSLGSSLDFTEMDLLPVTRIRVFSPGYNGKAILIGLANVVGVLRRSGLTLTPREM